MTEDFDIFNMGATAKILFVLKCDLATTRVRVLSHTHTDLIQQISLKDHRFKINVVR